MAGRELQAGALEFEAGEGFAVAKTDAHAVLAMDAELGGALGFDDPRGKRFPWDEDWFGGAFGHEADLAALAVEAGWDEGEAVFLSVVPDAEANKKDQGAAN